MTLNNNKSNGKARKRPRCMNFPKCNSEYVVPVQCLISLRFSRHEIPSILRCFILWELHWYLVVRTSRFNFIYDDVFITIISLHSSDRHIQQYVCTVRKAWWERKLIICSSALYTSPARYLLIKWIEYWPNIFDFKLSKFKSNWTKKKLILKYSCVLLLR